MKIEIQAELITTFHTFHEWVNKASGRLGCFDSGEIICIDKNGYSCYIGKDFMFARDHNLFPVTAYRFIRNTEKDL